MSKDLRLLALDGGGVRGLSALIILKQLMETVDSEAPPKPCEYFHMIAGTSTGGLIAIMLGRLRMTIDECIDAYLHLSEKVFQKKRRSLNLKGQIQGRFDSVELERAVKEVIREHGSNDDTLLQDTPEASCKVFVCAMRKETSGVVCLTSYKSPRGNSDLLNSVKIWEACRATSAASSFFEPIAIGRYGMEFVDGATGANNPVEQLWDQAKLVWGPEPLENKLQCLVSIGTGIPSKRPFSHDLRKIGSALVNLATQTEQTAEAFRRDKAHLGSDNRYFRFNVIRGLENIGLEESAKKKEIAAATQEYVESEDVLTQMRACAGTLMGRDYMEEYRTTFSLEGIPQVKQSVERPLEMAKLEHAFLPRRHKMQQMVFVLHGLGGMGKSQLAVDFICRHHRKFSSVFWLDGSSESNLKLSIARCATKVPAFQISDASRTYVSGSTTHIDDVVKEVMSWLAIPNNNRWLLVFDNVDREDSPQSGDPLAYDVRQYFSSRSHGSILVTTRLARSAQLGTSHVVNKMNRAQSQEVLESWYSGNLASDEKDRLFDLLDGLPLAIAQAGAYLQQSGVSLRTYLKFYEQQWDRLMETNDEFESSHSDYPNGSIWTTWTISFKAVGEREPLAADLLRLWSFFHNKDLWFDMFATAYTACQAAAAEVPGWIESLAKNQLLFTRSMMLLRRYSLVESVEGQDSYAVHPVVHRWARYRTHQDQSDVLARLAAVIVGFAVPEDTVPECPVAVRRLLPHADACFSVVADGDKESLTEDKESQTFMKAIHLFGNLYAGVDRLDEAEKVYRRVLKSTEAWGSEHIMTLNTLQNLGLLYESLGRIEEAETAYRRSLAGFERIRGLKHGSTLNAFSNLAILAKNQGRLKEAESLCSIALQGKEELFGSEHVSTLIL